MSSPIPPPERNSKLTTDTGVDTNKEAWALSKNINQSQSNPNITSSLSEIGGHCRESHKNLCKDSSNNNFMTHLMHILAIPSLSAETAEDSPVFLQETTDSNSLKIVTDALRTAMQTRDEDPIK